MSWNVRSGARDAVGSLGGSYQTSWGGAATSQSDVSRRSREGTSLTGRMGRIFYWTSRGGAARSPFGRDLYWVVAAEPRGTLRVGISRGIYIRHSL
jgi:hypothetical protein